MKITIFGTWYVGLVTGTCLAEVGHEVLCIDVDKKKIQDLKNAIIPIYEPGLKELVVKNTSNARLQFSTDQEQGILFWDAIFSAVGTPPDKNHKADLQYVKQVAKTFGKYSNRYQVFINKSTVPVGTGKVCKKIIEQELQQRWIITSFWGSEKLFESQSQIGWVFWRNEESSSNKAEIFSIVSNPEFLREGTAVKDFMVPERIVCGIESQRSREVMETLYKPLLRSYTSIIFTDIASSEVSKYAANAFLATKLSFINEIANFCEKVGANILDISKILGSDSRIWSKFLHAGIWYGGSCFPKDVQALIETGLENDYQFQIIKATEIVNNVQKTKLIEKLQEQIDIQDSVITLWGLSFKPKTDDIRDAPSLDIIESLLEKWASEIHCYDPVATAHVQKLYKNNPKVVFHTNALEAIHWSHALLLLTEWDEFRGVDFGNIKESMNGNLIIDGRNIWDKSIEKYGLSYISIGR